MPEPLAGALLDDELAGAEPEGEVALEDDELPPLGAIVGAGVELEELEEFDGGTLTVVLLDDVDGVGLLAVGAGLLIVTFDGVAVVVATLLL